MPGNGLMTEVVAGTTTMLITIQLLMQRTEMESHVSGKLSCSVESLLVQCCPSICHVTENLALRDRERGPELD